MGPRNPDRKDQAQEKGQSPEPAHFGELQPQLLRLFLFFCPSPKLLETLLGETANHTKSLGVSSPFFAGILLSGKPPDTLGKRPVIGKNDG